MNSPKESPDSRPLSGLDYLSHDAACDAVLETARKVAATPATVILLGESGTGKSRLARAIHRASSNQDKAFVTVSCPSLSGELLESELFGHRRGAFTGAVRDHWGKVGAASGGTLFLDEISDLPPHIQPKLLRLLQEREYERVGETETRQAEVRIIAATNQNLKQRVADGSFREDLYYRLNVVPLELPPLRDRPRDIERATRDYLEACCAGMGRPTIDFHPDAWETLLGYHWPGNFRELENVVQRALVSCRGNPIRAADLGLGEEAPHAFPRVGSPVSLAKLEATHIREVLRTSSTLAQAATILEIDTSTLFRKRKKYAI